MLLRKLFRTFTIGGVLTFAVINFIPPTPTVGNPIALIEAATEQRSLQQFKAPSGIVVTPKGYIKKDDQMVLIYEYRNETDELKWVSTNYLLIGNEVYRSFYHPPIHGMAPGKKVIEQFPLNMSELALPIKLAFTTYDRYQLSDCDEPYQAIFQSWPGPANIPASTKPRSFNNLNEKIDRDKFLNLNNGQLAIKLTGIDNASFGNKLKMKFRLVYNGNEPIIISIRPGMEFKDYQLAMGDNSDIVELQPGMPVEVSAFIDNPMASPDKIALMVFKYQKLGNAEACYNGQLIATIDL